MQISLVWLPCVVEYLEVAGTVYQTVGCWEALTR